MGTYAAHLKDQLDTTLFELEQSTKKVDEQKEVIQMMGEILSEVCHSVLSPRDDGHFNLTGTGKYVSFSPRTSQFVREALRPANDPLKETEQAILTQMRESDEGGE